MFKGMNGIAFGKKFTTNEDCFHYLMEIKWKEGYKCYKCEHDQYGKGRMYYYRRCKKCGYDESVLAHTVFHDMKVPVLKAFHMVFRIVTKKKGISSVELASEVGVEQKTAWLFKRKIQQTMLQSEGGFQLQDKVVCDETLVGGGRKGSYGRTHKQKSIAFVAIEKLSDGRTGNIAIEPLENFKLENMLAAVKKNVSTQALLYADDYTTNRGIKKRRGNMEIVMSRGSDFFEEIHKQIMMFKIWLSGIHHKCSKQNLKAYAAEYQFRFNRRNQREWIFHNLLRCVLAFKPCPYSMVKIK